MHVLTFSSQLSVSFFFLLYRSFYLGTTYLYIRIHNLLHRFALDSTIYYFYFPNDSDLLWPSEFPPPVSLYDIGNSLWGDLWDHWVFCQWLIALGNVSTWQFFNYLFSSQSPLFLIRGQVVTLNENLWRPFKGYSHPILRIGYFRFPPFISFPWMLTKEEIGWGQNWK